MNVYWCELMIEVNAMGCDNKVKLNWIIAYKIKVFVCIIGYNGAKGPP